MSTQGTTDRGSFPVLGVPGGQRRTKAVRASTLFENRRFPNKLSSRFSKKSGESDDLESQGRKNDHSPCPTNLVHFLVFVVAVLDVVRLLDALVAFDNLIAPSTSRASERIV